MNEKFVASVQHGDFKGSSAADEQDVIGISSWLKKNKHIRDNETLVGVQMISGGNHREHRFPAGVIF
jgi:hypothetical protein